MKNPIPEQVKKKLASNPFYYKCCIQDDKCSGHIQWHHNFRYAGSNLSEPFAILPVCVYHHSIEKRSDVKEKLDYIMLHRMTMRDDNNYLNDYWKQRKKYLTTKFASESFG